MLIDFLDPNRFPAVKLGFIKLQQFLTLKPRRKASQENTYI